MFPGNLRYSSPRRSWISTLARFCLGDRVYFPIGLLKRTKQVQKLALGEVQQAPQGLRGSIIYVDGFGNLVSNIDRQSFERFKTCFPSQTLFVTIDSGPPIELHKTYGDAPEGTLLALFGSFQMLEIAVRGGSAAERLAACPGAQVMVRIKR